MKQYRKNDKQFIQKQRRPMFNHQSSLFKEIKIFTCIFLEFRIKT